MPVISGSDGPLQDRLTDLFEYLKTKDRAPFVPKGVSPETVQYQQLYQRARSIIYPIVRNDDITDDLAQNVIFRTVQKLAKFQEESSFSTWFHRIAVNEGLDYLRKMKSHPEVFIADMQEDETYGGIETVDPKTPETEHLRHELPYGIIAGLAQLSAEDRELVLLKDQEGATIEELVEMTGRGENTLKVRLYRARMKIRKTYTKHENAMNVLHPKKNAISSGLTPRQKHLKKLVQYKFGEKLPPPLVVIRYLTQNEQGLTRSMYNNGNTEESIRFDYRAIRAAHAATQEKTPPKATAQETPDTPQTNGTGSLTPRQMELKKYAIRHFGTALPVSPGELTFHMVRHEKDFVDRAYGAQFRKAMRHDFHKILY